MLFRNVDQRIVKAFDGFRYIYNGPYIIKEDQPDALIISCDISEQDEEAIRSAAATYGVSVSRDDNDLTFRIDPIVYMRRDSLDLSEFDKETLDAIENAIIYQIGERFRPKLADYLRNVVIPVHIQDVRRLWKNHLDKKDPFESKLRDLVIIDSTGGNMDILVGWDALKLANESGRKLIETIDINDIIMAIEHKLLDEDQYKFATRKHLRQQSLYPSSFGPSRSFGGISGYNDKKNNTRHNMLEYRHGYIGRLTGDLIAHDNVTVIPSGSEIKIIDDDARLSDIEWNGKIINVDRDKLNKVFKPYAFADKLDHALESREMNRPIVYKDDFERHLNEAFGTDVKITEQDILLVIPPKTAADTIQEVKKEDKVQE
ncbi:MAG: hypothetical protein QXU32_01825 [Nitrososphaerales archaeon]